MHEILHAIGFWHEQSRSDRNTYVTVDTSKVKSGFEGNYNAYAPESVQDLGTYDYASVMHYGVCFFAIDCNVNGPPMTMNEPYFGDWLAGSFGKNPGLTEVGQYIGLSPIDVAEVNQVYEACLDDTNLGCEYVEVSGVFSSADEIYQRGGVTSNGLPYWEHPDGNLFLSKPSSWWRVGPQLEDGPNWAIASALNYDFIPPSQYWQPSGAIVQCVPGE